MPAQILDVEEAVSAVTLFFEEMLDTESPFEWFICNETVITNDLSASTISLKAPASLSACWR